MPVEISTTECASEQSDVYSCFRKKGLHFIHLNTRSLLPKIDELCHIANETGAAVIGVTETWFDSSVSDSEIEIPGYIIQRKDRRRTGGGVCMYINKDLAFTPAWISPITLRIHLGGNIASQNTPNFDWSLLPTS